MRFYLVNRCMGEKTDTLALIGSSHSLHFIPDPALIMVYIVAY